MATKKLSDRIIEATPGIDALAAALHKAYEPLLGEDGPKAVKDALYGVWLGHPLHPAVVTMPIGFWTTTMLLDLMGEEKVADLSLKLGTVSALAAAASGAAQWQDTYNLEKPRRLGALHASLNIAATTLYGASWVARARGSRGVGVALSTTAFGMANFSAWIGGDLSYDLGIGVNRTAFEQPPTEWTDVFADADLPEGKLTRVEAEGTAIVLLRQGSEIRAISAVCTHLGGPLDEGEIEGDAVVCPWHKSVFSLTDGKVIHGPATSPEPAYETRVQGGQVQVRAVA